MIRVLYVQPGRGVGGAKVSLAHLLRAYAGKQQSQLTLSPPVDKLFEEMPKHQVEKIHTLYLPTWSKRTGIGMRNQFLSFLVRLARGWYVWPTIQIAAIIMKERIDLVHTNNSICPVGAFAAFVTHKPHIWHVREPIGKDGQYPLTPGDRRTANLFSSLSKVIVCNSQYTASFFQSRGIEVQVILNGIETAKFDEAATRGMQLRQKLGLNPDDPVVGMVANIRVDWKEHDIFLRAASELLKSLPQCQFVLFGGSSDPQAVPYTRNLAEMAVQLNVDKQIIWADYIDDVPAIMNSMDIMIHPPSKEGSGRVVMEAMAAGKPVVAVRSGGVQELVQDGETGYLVQPGNWISLAEAAQRLLDKPGLRSEMGKRAKVYAREHFSHDRTAAAVQDLYQAIVSS